VHERHLPEAARQRYCDFRPLGGGGKGFVYLARDGILERDVALKIIRPELMQNKREFRRFKREILTVSKLTHPNVVQFYDYFEDDTSLCYAMEVVPGRTLKELYVEGTMTAEAVVDAVGQVAQGVAAMHDVGLFHRDLKADNVMVMPDGHVKIIDFGAVKHAANTEVTTLTRTGHVIGTIVNQPPEVFGSESYTASSDVYQLGLMLFEGLAGFHPLEGFSVRQIVRGEALARLSSAEAGAVALPTELREFVLRCIDPDPVRRPTSADGMVTFLSAWLLGRELARISGASGDGAASVVAPEPPRSEEPEGSWTGMALLVLALLVGGPLLFRTAPETPAPPVDRPSVVTQPLLRWSARQAFLDAAGDAFAAGSAEAVLAACRSFREAGAAGADDELQLQAAEAAAAVLQGDVDRLLEHARLVRDPSQVALSPRKDVFERVPLVKLALANRDRCAKSDFGRAAAVVVALGAEPSQRMTLAQRAVADFLTPFSTLEESRGGSKYDPSILMLRIAEVGTDDAIRVQAAAEQLQLLFAFVDGCAYFFGLRSGAFADVESLFRQLHVGYFSTWRAHDYRQWLIAGCDWALDGLARVRQPSEPMQRLFDRLTFIRLSLPPYEGAAQAVVERPLPSYPTGVTASDDRPFLEALATFVAAHRKLYERQVDRGRLVTDFGTVIRVCRRYLAAASPTYRTEAELLLGRALCWLAVVSDENALGAVAAAGLAAPEVVRPDATGLADGMACLQRAKDGEDLRCGRRAWFLEGLWLRRTVGGAERSRTVFDELRAAERQRPIGRWYLARSLESVQ